MPTTVTRPKIHSVWAFAGATGALDPTPEVHFMNAALEYWHTVLGRQAGWDLVCDLHYLHTRWPAAAPRTHREGLRDVLLGFDICPKTELTSLVHVWKGMPQPILEHDNYLSVCIPPDTHGTNAWRARRLSPEEALAHIEHAMEER